MSSSNDSVHGEFVTAEEAERRLLALLAEPGGKCQKTMWQLARLYRDTHQVAKEQSLTTEILELATDIEDRATCLHHLGQLMEQQRNYAEAVKHYRTALSMEPSHSEVWYYINNNLGFCLNVLGRHQEALGHLRTAIGIDPTLPNAHKNLGLSLQGLGDHAGAAACFITATRVNPHDGRSLRHLEELVAAHPELLTDVPTLAADVEWCRKAVAEAERAAFGDSGQSKR